MQITIHSPNNFKSLPWKNGNGVTRELAINPNGTLDNLEWRLSIASVVEDGLFSDFSGYQRCLILLKGQGIELHHDNGSIDRLTERLDAAHFDGANKTWGKLVNGAIEDFNLIYKKSAFLAGVDIFSRPFELKITLDPINFIYNPSETMISLEFEGQQYQVPAGHLAILEQATIKTSKCLLVQGEQAIIIQLQKEIQAA